MKHAADLEVEEHSHRGDEPNPPFPTQEALACALERSRKQKVQLAAPTQRRNETTLRPQYLHTSQKIFEASQQPVAWRYSLPLAQNADPSHKPAAALPEQMEEASAIGELPVISEVKAEEVSLCSRRILFIFEDIKL